MLTRAFGFTGPSHNLQIYGIKLLGVDDKDLRNLIFTVIFFLGLLVISKVLRALALHRIPAPAAGSLSGRGRASA